MPALRKTLDRITARRRQPSRPALPSNQTPLRATSMGQTAPGSLAYQAGQIARAQGQPLARIGFPPVVQQPATPPVNMTQQLLDTRTPAPPPAAQAMPGGPDMYGPDAQGFVPQPPSLATVQPTPPPPQAPPQPELGQQPGAFGQVSPPTAPPPVVAPTTPAPIDTQQLAQQYASTLPDMSGLINPGPQNQDTSLLGQNILNQTVTAPQPTLDQMNQMRGLPMDPMPGNPGPQVTQMGTATLTPEFLNDRFAAKATGSPVPRLGTGGDVYGPSPADMTAMIPGQPV